MIPLKLFLLKSTAMNCPSTNMAYEVDNRYGADFIYIFFLLIVHCINSNNNSEQFKFLI